MFCKTHKHTFSYTCAICEEELSYISNTSLIEFFRTGVRGQLSCAVTHAQHAAYEAGYEWYKAKNKHALKSTTPTKEAPMDAKFRRLKDNGVSKVKRFERELTCLDRDMIILWWNDNQRLVPENDPVCALIADCINYQATDLPLSSMQVAGYISYLCRLAMWDELSRQTRLVKSLERGAFSVMPIFTRPLLNAIIQNWQQEREDERLRAQAHAELRTARMAGRALRIKSGSGVKSVSVLTPMTTPLAPVKVASQEEEFDIKWM
jgi:hypothetical protein